jgi:hypothetical protein
VIHLVGHRVRQPSPEIEPHSAIDQAEWSDQLSLQGTGQRFAMQAAEPLRLRAPMAIAQHSGRRAAVTLALQANFAIRQASEMLGDVQLDLRLTPAIEPPSATDRDE